jgi:membrane protease YdiL (CAAX protease family)
VQIALLGLIAAGVLWFGKTKKFFEWNPKKPWESRVSLPLVIGAFAIYFAISFFISPLYLKFMVSHYPERSQIGLASWLNFFNSGSIFLGLLAYWRCLPPVVRHGIAHCPSTERNFFRDFKMGMVGWVLSFPLVIFLTTFFEWFVTHVLKASYIPDQLAVYFVKMTFADPLYFAMTIITIVVITPLVEETLFRGFLQSFIRTHLGSKQAILITSACFAFFHYAPEQGLGNIPIVGTLFSLALFLGFLYEKQGSLFASIALHGLFNGISILNLYFLGRIPFFF